MKHETKTRIIEMHDSGFSPATIHKNLNEQNHQISYREIYKVLSIKPKEKIPRRKLKGCKFRVREENFTYKTTDELKKRYYKICELLNKGFSAKEISEQLSITQNQVQACKHKHLEVIK